MLLAEIIVGILLFGIGLYTTLMWRHLETKFRHCEEQYMALNDREEKLAERLTHLKSCQHNMETNYIGRFSDMKEHLARNKEEIILTIHSMENRLRDNMANLANGRTIS